MDISSFRELSARWREEALLLQRRGAERSAKVLESVAEDLDATIRDWLEEELDIGRAAEESGYSEDRLRELVREGRIPDTRPPGSAGRISIRRADLPRRPGTDRHVRPVEEFANQILAQRKRRTGAG